MTDELKDRLSRCQLGGGVKTFDEVIDTHEGWPIK
jgi:hypothetical protein